MAQTPAHAVARPAQVTDAPSKLPDMSKATPITSANLKDRTYSDSWPKPSFPSSERAGKQFTVEYVYRYVQSDYTPAVVLPQVRHSEAESDTPEHTLIALLSAVKTLDYDWWLSLWDTKSQQLFRDEATAKKQDSAYWKAVWQKQYVGKPATLVSRIETVNDIMLEFRVGPLQPGAGTGLQPVIVKRENGRWVLTRELGEFSFMPWTGRDTISGSVDIVQTPQYSDQPVSPAILKTQNLFLANQARGQSSATEFVW